MNFYLIQYKRETWLDTILILRGDIQKHLVVIERLQTKFPHNTYRLKRITEKHAVQLFEQGYVVYTAPEELTDV
jgi:hypothetical protein